MWYRHNINAVCRKETSRILNLCFKVDFAGSFVSAVVLRIWCMIRTCTDSVFIPTGRVWTIGFRYRIHVCLVSSRRMRIAVDSTPLCGFMVCHLNTRTTLPCAARQVCVALSKLSDPNQKRGGIQTQSDFTSTRQSGFSGQLFYAVSEDVCWWLL
jgi:hypothetical protein